MDDPGREFVEALAVKDIDRLGRVLAANVDFKGITPGAHWEAGTAKATIEDVLFQWFEDHDHIDEILGIEEGSVVDRKRITYRFLISTPDGPHEVEQQMYYETVDGRITMARTLCSGFRPLS